MEVFDVIGPQISLKHVRADVLWQKHKGGLENHPPWDSKRRVQLASGVPLASIKRGVEPPQDKAARSYSSRASYETAGGQRRVRLEVRFLSPPLEIARCPRPETARGHFSRLVGAVRKARGKSCRRRKRWNLNNVS